MTPYHRHSFATKVVCKRPHPCSFLKVLCASDMNQKLEKPLLLFAETVSWIFSKKFKQNILVEGRKQRAKAAFPFL